MTSALTKALAEQQSDVISTDTIRVFNSYLKMEQLRGNAVLAVTTRQEGLRCEPECSAATIFLLSDQRPASILWTMALLWGLYCFWHYRKQVPLVTFGGLAYSEYEGRFYNAMGKQVKLTHEHSYMKGAYPAVINSPMQVQYGNPELSSSRNQAVHLIYSYIGPWLTLQLAPAFKYYSDGIGRLIYAQDDVRYQTYDNIEKLTRWQLEGYVQWKPFKGTTLSANFNLWDDKIENPSIGLSQKGYSGFYYLNGSQKLPWKLRLTAYTYGEMGHSVNNVYSYSRPWNRYGCSLQRSFLSEDRLTVRISANDLFRKYRHYTDCTTRCGWWNCKGKIENDLHTYIKVLKSIIYTIFSELLNLHKTYIIPT